MSRHLAGQAVQDPMAVPDWPTNRAIFDHCLKVAEHTFGERDTSWSYVVKCRQDGRGPETINDGKSQICIWLSNNLTWIGCYFESAHEAVHCLNPNIPSESATWMEEAIAATFGLKVVLDTFGSQGLRLTRVTADYLHAMEMVSKIDADPIEFGKRMRDKAGAFGQVSPADLMELYPDVSEDRAIAALSKFPRQ